ncbi:MAG TPA: hypothetical protein DCR20_06770 [Planctomycetaceae bacterium]|nr:hypothetical protein [Planctomycetaceae bacterium]
MLKSKGVADCGGCIPAEILTSLRVVRPGSCLRSRFVWPRDCDLSQLLQSYKSMCSKPDVSEYDANVDELSVTT